MIELTVKVLICTLIVIFIDLLLYLLFIFNKERSSMKRRRWYPFKRLIYKFKYSHQCIFCKYLTIKRKLVFAPVTNHDGILTGDTIEMGFHTKCLKKVLTEPEKYSIDDLTFAVYLPEYLKRQQEKIQQEKDRQETERLVYVEKAKAANFALFIDEASGKITFGGKK